MFNLFCLTFSTAPLSNGTVGSDAAPPQWLNGIFSCQINNQSMLATAPTQAHPKPPECIYQPVFKPELFATPTAAATAVLQPNFQPVTSSFSLFSSLYAPLNRTTSQLDTYLTNGSCPDNVFATNRNNIQSSPVDTPMGTMVTKLSKPDVLPCGQTNESDRLGSRSTKPFKHSTFTRNVLKSTSESTCVSGSVESQGNAANGIVHNTLRKTRSDMKVIHRYLMQVKHDTREIHLIPHYELDQYIQDFVLTAKKKDGHEYEPESLKAFVHSLERHLKHHDYPHSVLKGNAFAGTRSVLNQRLSELRALSRSGSTTLSALNTCTMDAKRSAEQTGAESAIQSGGTKRSLTGRTFTPSGLMQAGLLGNGNPQAILNSLWLMNRTQFNIGGTQRHRNLVWGQFQLVTDETGTRAIKFTPLFESAEVRYCRGYGGIRGCGPDATGRSSGSTQALSCTGAAKRQPLPFNCVELFEIYGSLRSPDACGVSEPFYLCPEPLWEQTGCWFKTNAAGSQLLARIPRLLGLKPNRESVLSIVPEGCDSELPQIGSYEISQHQDNRYRDESNSPVGGKPINPILGRQVLEKHSMQTQNQTRYMFPAACPPLAQSFFNFFPLMFPPSADSASIPTTSQFPCMLPPSTAYSNAMPYNAEPLSSMKSKTDQEIHGLLQHTPIRLRQREADEISRLGGLEYHNLGEQTLSPERSIPSPGSQLRCYAAVTSPNGTASPTEAENMSALDASPRLSSSLIDTTQPNNLLSRLQTGSKGILCGSSSKEACSPQHSSDSHSSSRPQSVASRISLVESSESILRIEVHADPGPTHTLEQRTASGLPNEALNLVSNKQEESSYA